MVRKPFGFLVCIQIFQRFSLDSILHRFNITPEAIVGSIITLGAKWVVKSLNLHLKNN